MERIGGWRMKYFVCCVKKKNFNFYFELRVKSKEDVKCVSEVLWLLGYVYNLFREGIKKKN